MANAPFARIALTSALYLGLALALTLAPLVPLNPGEASWPGPELLFCLTIAWILRRPDLLPPGVVAAAGLLADLLLQRPPGLWAALLLWTTERMRQRSQPGEAPSPGSEVVLFAWLFIAAVTLNWLVLAVFMVPQPTLGAVLAQVPATVLAYPVVVLLLVHGFGISRPTESRRRLSRGRT